MNGGGRAAFAPFHVELWEWVWNLTDTEKPSPLIAIWPREGGKSTSAELACVALGHKRVKKYIIYISGTQAQANDHINNIGNALESSGELRFDDPELCTRRIGAYGASKGWRMDRLRTASGLTVDAVGLDGMGRGTKLESMRPDMLILDDIDKDRDTELLVQKKIDALTRKIIPSGGPSVAILGIQNLVHNGSVFSRLADGRADFLSTRKVSGPYPALDNLTYKKDKNRVFLTGGDPTWEHLSLDRCQRIVDDIGLVAFLGEYQHDRTAQRGAFFGDLWTESIHVIDPFPIPLHWYIDRSFDWGEARPFSVCWFAESDGSEAPNGRTYPKGTLFLIHEWYGWNGQPNEGLRMLARDVARGIASQEKARWQEGRVHAGPADNQIFTRTNGVCIADDMADEGITWTNSDKRPGSRANGARIFREYLQHSTESPMEGPGLFIFRPCAQFIRTLPALPTDLRNPDDIHTDSEDHIYDSARYRILDSQSVATTMKVSG
jgi:hypothetical protein